MTQQCHVVHLVYALSPQTRREGVTEIVKTKTRDLRSEAESCAVGLSWHNRPVERETKLDFSAGMKWNQRPLKKVRVSARTAGFTVKILLSHFS